MFKEISTYGNDIMPGSIQDQFKMKKKHSINIIEEKWSFICKKKKLEIESLLQISHTSKSR